MQAFFIGFQPRRSLLSSRKAENGENGVTTAEGAVNGVVGANEDGETKGNYSF